MGVLFSFLIPAYNVEKYITQCLNSILQCTRNDYEVIVVDDGSTDKTGDICLKYANQHPQFRFISKTNGGMVSARIEALKHARGQYCFFCDSDDYFDSYLLNGFLNDFADKLEPNTLHCFSFRNVWPNYIEAKSAYKDSEFSFATPEEKILFLSSQLSHTTMGYAVWDKLYCRSTISKNQIKPISKDLLGNNDDWAEDLLFNLQYLMCVDRIVVHNIPMYMLRKHGEKEEQSEQGLVNRINHMMNIMNALFRNDGSYQNEQYKMEFYKIVIWHLRRYIYLSVQANGVEKTRDACQSCSCWALLSDSIDRALKDDMFFDERWNKVMAKDYKYLLQYIKKGNILLYKMKQYYLWKVYVAFKKQTNEP